MLCSIQLVLESYTLGTLLEILSNRVEESFITLVGKQITLLYEYEDIKLTKSCIFVDLIYKKVRLEY